MLAQFPEKLPLRPGPPPQTSSALPSVQLSQWPPEWIASALVQASVALPNVRVKQSRMAAPDTQALWLPDGVAFGPASAFIDDHEFCHLHALPEAGLHLTLPTNIRRSAIESGWARLHPAVRAGFLPESVVMVYAPRTLEELQIAILLVTASYRFAIGR